MVILPSASGNPLFGDNCNKLWMTGKNVQNIVVALSWHKSVTRTAYTGGPG